MKRIYTLAILFFSINALAADPKPYLKSAPIPLYPPLCRAARISGTVTLHFEIDEQGDVSHVNAVGGPQLLRAAATQNVQGWKFAWPSRCDCRVKSEVVFVYSFGDWLVDDGPSSVVKWFDKSPVRRVEIQTGSTLVQP
jgi:TonB family protein